MIVADSSVMVQACLSGVDLESLSSHRLIAPALLWSEVVSVIHELKWRRRISTELASTALDRLRRAPVQQRQPAALQREAWRLAERFGWAKTYEANYIALAVLAKCRLLTIDARLAAMAASVVDVIGPAEL